METLPNDNAAHLTSLGQLREILLSADMKSLVTFFGKKTHFPPDKHLHTHKGLEISFCFDSIDDDGNLGVLNMIRIAPDMLPHPALYLKQRQWQITLLFEDGFLGLNWRTMVSKIPLQKKLDDYGIDFKSAFLAVENYCLVPKNHESLDLEHLRFLLGVLISALYHLFMVHDMKFSHNAVEMICNYIVENYSRGDLTIAEIAKAVNLSPNYLQRIFYSEMGCKPRQYLMEIRLTAADQLLKKNKYLVKEVAEMCGWNCPHYFSNCYRKYFGYYPTQPTSEYK